MEDPCGHFNPPQRTKAHGCLDDLGGKPDLPLLAGRRSHFTTVGMYDPSTFADLPGLTGPRRDGYPRFA